MNQQEQFIQSLNISHILGEGGFGEVFLATTDDGEKYAIKCLSKEHNSLISVDQEINAGILLNHPNLVKYKTHFHDEENYYIIFELVEGNKKFLYNEA